MPANVYKKRDSHAHLTKKVYYLLSANFSRILCKDRIYILTRSSKLVHFSQLFYI